MSESLAWEILDFKRVKEPTFCKKFLSRCCNNVKWCIFVDRGAEGDDVFIALYLADLYMPSTKCRVAVNFAVMRRNQRKSHCLYSSQREFTSKSDYAVGQYIKGSRIDDYLVNGALHIQVNIRYLSIEFGTAFSDTFLNQVSDIIRSFQ